MTRGLEPPHDDEAITGSAAEDAWLVGKAQQGDLDAYESLIRRHRQRIFRIALRILGDPADADDVAQEVVIQLWTALSSFAGTSSFTTWLYRVVVNRSLSHRRSSRPTDELLETDHPTVAGTEDQVLDRRRLAAGLDAVGALPDDLRVALVLCQLEGLTYQQAAAALDVTEDTVRGRLHRARRALLVHMKDWS